MTSKCTYWTLKSCFISFWIGGKALPFKSLSRKRDLRACWLARYDFVLRPDAAFQARSYARSDDMVGTFCLLHFEPNTSIRYKHARRPGRSNGALIESVLRACEVTRESIWTGYMWL